jgi:hypothetical protein
MLRSDLETLLAEGELDLEELGLTPTEDETETQPSEIFAVFRNLADRFQRGPQDTDRKTGAAAGTGNGDEGTQVASGQV